MMATRSYRDVWEGRTDRERAEIVETVSVRLKRQTRTLPDELEPLALPRKQVGLQTRVMCPCCGAARPDVCLTDVRGRLPGYTFVGDCCWVQWVREGREINGAVMTRERWHALAQGQRTEGDRV